MASTYNPYSDVSEIYKLKGQWDSANKAGDTTKQNEIAAKAQAYYKNLRDNNYGDVADALTASNYQQAKSINDKWAKMSKTPTRDYLYTLGQSYGMSSADVDKLIGWDNQTGEVSFGGKKIGTPDAVVDGVSYWSDTSVLDNAFKDYIGRTGTTRDKALAVNQENESLFAKYNDTYEDLIKTNPFKTDEAKAILAKYDLAGLQARDNAAASGGASNGGNIDSYAAANAMRQQASLVTQGQNAVLDAHQQKIDNVRGLLSDMGVNIDRVYTQDETTKAREWSQAEEQRQFDQNSADKRYEIDANKGVALAGLKSNETIAAGNNKSAETIAAGNNKSAETIADINADVSKQVSADNLAGVRDTNDSNEAIAGTQATATVNAAQIAADSAKYQSDNDYKATKYVTDSGERQNSDNNDSNEKIVQMQKKDDGPTEITNLTGNSDKEAKSVMDKINTMSKNKYGVEVLSTNGTGKYFFTLPKNHQPGWWDDIIIKEFAENMSSTDDFLWLIDKLGFQDYLPEFNTKYKLNETTGRYEYKGN